MIHYQLRCGREHEFDGWFSDSAGFDEQSARGFIACPVCGDPRVRRAMMAPSVPKRRTSPAQVVAQGTAEPLGSPAPVVPPPLPGSAISGPIPDHMRAMLQRMRAEVEKNCDNVGTRFAEEARRIHYGEAEERGIYGDATPEEAEALAEEGVEITRIPWIGRADG